MAATMWYNLALLLSFNALIYLIVGARGCGKTFSAKEYVVKNFIEKGEQFIYLRRWGTEFDKNNEFFDALVNEGKFKDVKFRVEGMTYFINGKIAGYAIPLSTSRNLKSSEFPNVTTILFDEFIIDPNDKVHHYIGKGTSEVDIFLDLCETIIRMRDNVKIILMSNSCTVTNPYFLKFNIMPNGNEYQRICYKDSDGNRQNDIVLNMPKSNEYKKAKKLTRFGHLISSVDYGKYALENEFKDNSTFVEKKSNAARYSFTFDYQNTSYGVWVDYKIGKMYVSYKVDPTCKTEYALTVDDHAPNLLLLKALSHSYVFSQFLDAYKMGCVYFEDVNIKNIVTEVIRLSL